MPPIKVGIIALSSTGRASRALVPGLLNAPSFSLMAVSTSSSASTEAFAQKYIELSGHLIKASHSAASSIANDINVDLVAVSVKVPLHKEAALTSIEAEKNLLVEWPAGANITETEEIVVVAKAKGVKTLKDSKLHRH